MLPIYKAISFDKILSGGSTRPWLIVVGIEGKPVPYVVKLYTTKTIQDNWSVAKEVYCSVLGAEFELNIPKPALIEFTKEFIEKLPLEVNKELITKDGRLKFGSMYIDGAFPFINDTHRENLKKYDIETIYAFDNLIRNNDRNLRKPNILLKGSDAFLIDHELSLVLNQHALDQFHQGAFNYNYQSHIFYPFLKGGTAENKKCYFDDFLLYLNNLQINKLDPYYTQLVGLDHHTEEDYVLLKQYLSNLKQNSTKFVNILKAYLN